MPCNYDIVLDTDLQLNFVRIFSQSYQICIFKGVSNYRPANENFLNSFFQFDDKRSKNVQKTLRQF